MNEGAKISVNLVEETDDPIVLEIFDNLSAQSTGIVNLHRTLANSPDIFSAFIGLAHAARFKSEIDPALRELAILRALFHHRGHYEIGHHRRLGKAAGLSEKEMEIACSDTASTALNDEAKRSVVTYADQFARGHGIGPALAAAIREVLSDRGIVELSITLALYVGMAYFTASVEVPVDSPVS